MPVSHLRVQAARAPRFCGVLTHGAADSHFLTVAGVCKALELQRQAEAVLSQRTAAALRSGTFDSPCHILQLQSAAVAEPLL